MGLLAILLDARRAKSRKSMLVDRLLPGDEFFDGQRIALAGFFEAEQAAAHGGHDFGLAANDPALGIARREVRDRQRTSIRSDDVLDSRTNLIGHSTLTLNLTLSYARLLAGS